MCMCRPISRSRIISLVFFVRLGIRNFFSLSKFYCCPFTNDYLVCVCRWILRPCPCTWFDMVWYGGFRVYSNP